MASNNLGSYVSLIKLLKSTTPTGNARDIKIIQLDMFSNKQGGVLLKTQQNRLNLNIKPHFFCNFQISRMLVKKN
jgi:hypothetical protein